VPSRDRKTLLPLIQRHVAEGSEIHMDCWADYNGLSELGYKHLTVNYEQFYVDPDTGAHTQNVESFWSRIRFRLVRYMRHHLGSNPKLLHNFL
jgi:hypothetical protein